MKTTRIYINRQILKSNNRKGPSDREPPITVWTYNETKKCNEVQIEGPSTVVYSPDKPLSCGARVWIETTAKVVCK